MSNGFSITEFLEEYGTDFEPKYDVLQMKISGGFGVFAGRQSKFFETLSNEKSVTAAAREEARKYIAGLKGLDYEPKVYPAVEQVWFTPILNRDKQPNWENGEWREMKRRTVVQINGEWQETGDWVAFKRQWADDNAPLNDSHFGKKLWVLANFIAHPDFDENAPDKYTAQMKDGQFVVDEQTGKYKPQYIRVVHQVLGDRAAADAWLAANGGGEQSGGGEQKDDLEKALLALRSELPPVMRKEYKTDDQWVGSAMDIFNGFHKHEDQTVWVESNLVTQEVLDKIEELTNVYPPF